jgi:DNA replication protein DnaC
MALLGTDTLTGSQIVIGDIERRSGLYILGKPGMGKSTLLVNMIIQDIVNTWNSVFFSILMAMRYGIFSQIMTCVRKFESTVMPDI